MAFAYKRRGLPPASSITTPLIYFVAGKLPIRWMAVLSGSNAGYMPLRLERRTIHAYKIGLYVGNLSKSTTYIELNTLFAQAGNVTAAEVIRDRHTGESKGFGFVTVSAQSEADQAISMFNTYSLSGTSSIGWKIGFFHIP